MKGLLLKSHESRLVNYFGLNIPYKFPAVPKVKSDKKGISADVTGDESNEYFLVHSRLAYLVCATIWQGRMLRESLE